MLNTIKYGSVVLGMLFPFVTHAYPCASSGHHRSLIGVCDAIFINPPLFGTLCASGSVTADYTIHNGTSTTLTLSNIHLQRNDSFPVGSATIVPALTNPCGSTLAPGASCEIGVRLTSTTTSGSFNRVLIVGINTRQVQISAPAITTTVNTACTTPPPTPPAGFTPTVPNTPAFLFSASLLGASTITNTGPSIVSGDVDLTPGSAITGFPPGTIVNGVENINNLTAANVKTAANNYFTGLHALACSNTYGAGTDISTLSPINCGTSPVNCFTSSALMTGPVILTGTPGSSCTFVIGSTLTVANGATMTTTGGIFNDNISWAIGSSATLGVGSTLIGIIDATASITLNTGANLFGRAWALNGAVTLADNSVSPQG